MLMIFKATVMLGALMNAGPAPAQALPDPTRPYGFGSVVEIERIFIPDKKIEWRLSGIRIDDKQRNAILNGRLVREGTDLGMATVVEIRPTELVLSQDHKRLVIKLLLSDIKRFSDEGLEKKK
ncbi:MAG: hypothetical protein O6928_03105 [Gammaproteobacteria bacterium]|nr:hypothetical protein [Gammaproteobacteria bacterium]